MQLNDLPYNKQLFLLGVKGRSDFIGTSDEDSMNDNASIISLASDGTFLEEGKNCCNYKIFVLFCDLHYPSLSRC